MSDVKAPTQEELVTIARERYKAMHTAENDLRDSMKPTLILERFPETHDAGAGLTLRCPGCGHTERHEDAGDGIYDTELRDVDLAERWSGIDAFHDKDVVLVNYDSHGDYEGVTLLMTCCYTPVDLPEGWATEGSW